MLDRLWQHQEQRFGALTLRPQTWPAGALGHFQALTRTGAFDALASEPRPRSDRHPARPDHLARPRAVGPAARDVTRCGTVATSVPRGWHRDSSDRPGDPVLVHFASLAALQPHGA
jgi:hypothetical protein